MSDWKRYGLHHLEIEGAIINIREHLTSSVGEKVTHVEILPDPGWKLQGYVNNKLIKKESGR